MVEMRRCPRYKDDGTDGSGNHRVQRCDQRGELAHGSVRLCSGGHPVHADERGRPSGGGWT